MAATRLIALHARKGQSVSSSLSDRTDYAKNPEKTEKGELITAKSISTNIPKSLLLKNIQFMVG